MSLVGDCDFDDGDKQCVGKKTLCYLGRINSSVEATAHTHTYYSVYIYILLYIYIYVYIYICILQYIYKMYILQSTRLGFLDAEANVLPYVAYAVLDLLVIPLLPKGPRCWNHRPSCPPLSCGPIGMWFICHKLQKDEDPQEIMPTKAEKLLWPLLFSCCQGWHAVDLSGWFQVGADRRAGQGHPLEQGWGQGRWRLEVLTFRHHLQELIDTQHLDGHVCLQRGNRWKSQSFRSSRAADELNRSFRHSECCFAFIIEIARASALNQHTLTFLQQSVQRCPGKTHRESPFSWCVRVVRRSTAWSTFGLSHFHHFHAIISPAAGAGDHCGAVPAHWDSVPMRLDEAAMRFGWEQAPWTSTILLLLWLGNLPDILNSISYLYIFVCCFESESQRSPWFPVFPLLMVNWRGFPEEVEADSPPAHGRTAAAAMVLQEAGFKLWICGAPCGEHLKRQHDNNKGYQKWCQ